MENDNNTKITDKGDFIANLYLNHKKKLATILLVTICFFALFYYLFDYPMSKVEEVESVQQKTKSAPTLKSSLENFISTGDSKNLKEIFENIDNVSVWVFPPEKEYEWKIMLRDLPKEVNKYRDLGELWNIDKVISIDTLENEKVHVELRFTNN